MPLLSRRRRAVAAICRSRRSRFCAKGVNENEDELSDVDDYRLSNSVDIADIEELDHIEDVKNEDIPLLSEDFVAKCYLWRANGNNSGVRGFGTSHRTFKRSKKELKERAYSALTCRNIADFLVHKSVKESINLSSFIPLEANTDDAIIASAVTDDVDDNEVPNAEMNEINHGEDFLVDDLSLLDPCNILGDENVKKVDAAPPKHSIESAIDNLLNEEGKVTRNKKLEKKNFFERYQTVQAMALIRYFQLLLEGTEKTTASAEVASDLYNKKGIWSYKARSVRGWADLYMKTGADEYILSLFVTKVSSQLLTKA